MRQARTMVHRIAGHQGFMQLNAAQAFWIHQFKYKDCNDWQWPLHKQTDRQFKRTEVTTKKTVLCHFCIFCGRRYPILFQPPFHDLMVGVSIFACLGFSLDGIVKGIREVLFASSNRGQMFWAPSEAVNITCLTSEFSLFLTISLPLAVGLQVK